MAATTTAGAATAPVDYLLHLADNALVLGQRNAEWCGHGPVLEEDIAMANISLDLIGQARLLYQHAAALIGEGVTEDRLAYFRDARKFRNYTMLELPHHGPLAGTAVAERDYATAIVRNFLYCSFALPLWTALHDSADAQLAAIAERAVKETHYQRRHARDWLVRLGDGTDLSHDRAQAALDHLMPYTQEFWSEWDAQAQAVSNRTGVSPDTWRGDWDAEVNAALAEATLRRPAAGGYVPRGQEGLHSEHLGYLLAEMQGLAREHPEAIW